MGCKQEILLESNLQGQIGCVSASCMLQHIGRAWLEFQQTLIDQGPHGNAFPAGVEFGPAGDAVNVQLYFGLGQLDEILPAQADLSFDLSPDPEPPGLRIKRRHAPIMEDRESHRQALARRQPSFLFHLFFKFPAIDWVGHCLILQHIYL